MVSRSNVRDIQLPLSDGVVIAFDVLGVEDLETASSTVKFGLNKTIFSFDDPPFTKNPSPVVGIVVFEQLHVVQFRSTCTVLSILPHPCVKLFCPYITKYLPGFMTVFGGIVTEYCPLVTI